MRKKLMLKRLLIWVFHLVIANGLMAQDAHQLIEQVRARLEGVTSYEADGLMKTNVSFLKLSDAVVKIYYKQPDKLKIKNEKGISLVPRGAMVFSMNSLLRGDFTAIDAGRDSVNGTTVRVVKLIPMSDSAEWVIATVYVDEKQHLIMKAKTTTRDKGTFEVELKYGKYSSYALPDKITCSFSTKEYKLPKGITFDYDDGVKKTTVTPKGDAKGVVQIIYSNYSINKRFPDNVF
jgi:outer membrane lipoprotein-sorting protein